MRKIFLGALAVLAMSCSENAHLTRPDLGNENNGLAQKPSDPPAQLRMRVTLEEIASEIKVFSGLFVNEGNLGGMQPVDVDADSQVGWERLAGFFNGRTDGDIENVRFDKVSWAVAFGYNYRLFDIYETYVIPVYQRNQAKSVKLTLTQTFPGQESKTVVKEFPIQYRYVIDDEALNQGKVGKKNDAYYAQGLVPGRYVRGLEYVSNRNLLYRNINCHNGYDFIDTYVFNGRNNFKARVIARRNQAGVWTPYQQMYSTLLGAVGFALTGKRSAYFSDVLAYGGNCAFKVQGLMSVAALTSDVIDGVRVELMAQNGEKGFADFGVTVLEAY
ncbi:MAG: hypothetical protein JNM24_06040 [Bdellovibrionaceae bacterium]|nr:hypothetical protein [Pseudobdellovibrionaceae bacterium]